MDNRFVMKRNQMRQRRLSTELENIHARLEGSLFLIEHEVSEIKKDTERQSDGDPEIDISYFKRKGEIKSMEGHRRRASSFSTVEGPSNTDSPRKPSLHLVHEKRGSVSKLHKIESPIAEYIASPVPSFARARRMSLPVNLTNSHEPFTGLRSGPGSPLNRGSNSSLKGSHGELRKSRDSIGRSRDSSPESEKYESQMRRLKRELNQRVPKTIKQLEKVPLTSTEEKHIIRFLKDEEKKMLNEKRNAEMLEGIKNCSYLRTNNPKELTIEEILDRSPD